ncbi:MAG TPA: zf-TFIIB domain-containing protein [Tepidisphaeraceae bacterium]|nr:zf-TFIIB domain-containing protein [Tepidisphaeraceae bacterium]
MKCPNCNEDLRPYDRHGVEIDLCPKCRGVWLDRGELDKIMEREAQFVNAPPPPPPGRDPRGYAPDPRGYANDPRRHDDDDDDHYKRHGGHRRKSFWAELFD